ncbi:Serine/arginine-rich splicing factor 12 [Linnemannia gamsii]|uniref:Serine/arginine-rich splicing factor 12 n=1 Tax=Linnemannia gamsii TaxID=64522 RepID=A0ABQ7JLR5_9FUNG|nr:Serine/arginine-rich splicing factor 12 [Linnemannia gamsii]
MPPRDRQNDAISLYVSGFKETTRPSDLATLFEPHGRIADVYIPKDYYSGLPRGFAYIQYHDEEDTRRVFESGETFILDGRKLGLQYAQGRRKKPVDEEAAEEEEIVAAPDPRTATTDQVIPAVTRAHDLPPEIAVIAAVTAVAPDVVARKADRAQDPLDPVLALALAPLAVAPPLPVDVATADRPRPDAARLPLAAALPLPDVAPPLPVIALPQEAEVPETAGPR